MRGSREKCLAPQIEAPKAPSGVRYGEECSFPSRLGGLKSVVSLLRGPGRDLAGNTFWRIFKARNALFAPICRSLSLSNNVSCHIWGNADVLGAIALCPNVEPRLVVPDISWLRCRWKDHMTSMWRHRERPAVAEVVVKCTSLLCKVRALAVVVLDITIISQPVIIISIIIIIIGCIIIGVSEDRDTLLLVQAAAAVAVRPAHRLTASVATRYLLHLPT